MKPSDGSLIEVSHARIRPPKGGWSSPAALSLLDYGGSDPADAILRRAAQLIREAGVTRPPHEQLARIGSFQGVRWIETARMNEAGRLISTPRGILIQVNQDHSTPRRNFSICHEIGHTLIPDFWEGNAMCFDQETGAYEPDVQEEFLCDLAAAELLMPTEGVSYMLRSHGPQVWLVEAVAKRFGASLEAAAIKCASCGVDEMAALVWEPGPRLKFAACGLGFEDVVFRRGPSLLSGTSIEDAARGDGAKGGEVVIDTLDGPRRLLAVSQGYPPWVDRPHSARKVISLVFPLKNGTRMR